MAYIVQHPLFLRQIRRQIDRWIAIEWQPVKIEPGTVVSHMVSFWLASNLACIVPVFHSEMQQQFVFLLDSNMRNCINSNKREKKRIFFNRYFSKSLTVHFPTYPMN